MNYLSYAESDFFFNFVFYEVENKTMYVYCPNCGSEHEIDLRHTTVAKAKKTYPCTCFSNRASCCSAHYYRDNYPHFYHASKTLTNLNQCKFVAEFDRSDDKVNINVYNVVANFGAGRYEYEGPTCFKRYPIFDTQLVSTITFDNLGNVSMQTKLFKYMGGYAIHESMHLTKSWATAMADAVILRESTRELKGTSLEQWTNTLDEINEAYSNKTNLSNWSNFWDAFTVGVLIDLHQNVAYRKMWKAGFTAICINHTMRLRVIRNNYMYTSHNLGHVDDRKIINWRAKTLDKIFKVEIPKIDKVLERDKAEVNQVLAVQRMIKLNIPLTADNHHIYTNHRMPELEELCLTNNVSLPAIIKYLRKGKVLPHDYHDYLRGTVMLNVPLTKDVLFPKNFKQAHDRQITLLNAQKSAISNRAFTEAVKQYIGANFKDDRYSVKLIDTVDKLKRWGAKMHNCSGGYVDRVINRHSVIFIVVETAHPRQAFAMLEYSPARESIVQLRGVHNQSCDVVVQNWVQLWLSIKLLPLLNAQKRRAG